MNAPRPFGTRSGNWKKTDAVRPERTLWSPGCASTPHVCGPFQTIPPVNPSSAKYGYTADACKTFDTCAQAQVRTIRTDHLAMNGRGRRSVSPRGIKNTLTFRSKTNTISFRRDISSVTASPPLFQRIFRKGRAVSVRRPSEEILPVALNLHTVSVPVPVSSNVYLSVASLVSVSSRRQGL